jgi:hypothetical protein
MNSPFAYAFPVNNDSLKPRWAPKVPQRKIRALYEGAACGLLDTTLLDDVGIALELRCRSMLAVADVMMRDRIPCPRCGHVTTHDPRTFAAPALLLICPTCLWHLTWGEYHQTFRHHELFGADGLPFIAQYTVDWPAARTPCDKLLLIDQLLHLWHWEEVRHERAIGRPSGVNFIEGGRRAVLAFLDTLTYGEQTPPELRERQASWRANWNEVKAMQQSRTRPRHGD